MLNNDRRQLLEAGLTAGVVSLVAGSSDATAAELLATGRSVSEFGVKPGAGGDQAGRLQAAISQTSEQGLPLFFPSGTYVVGQTLRLPAMAQLVGAPGSLIKGAHDGPLLVASESRHIMVEGLSFSGGKSRRALVQLGGEGEVILARCHVEASDGAGFALDGVVARILACSVRGASGAAIACSDNPAVWLTDNIIGNCNSGLMVRNAREVHVTGNSVAQTAQQAVVVEDAASGVIVANNIVETARSGIVIRAGAGGAGKYAVQANMVRNAEIGIGAGLDQNAFAMIATNMISATRNGAIRALDGTRPIGPDLARESAESFRNLAIFANIAL